MADALPLQQTLLQDHETINGLVHELIVPSVKCKIEELRQHGLICLGLCTLLDRVSPLVIKITKIWP